jgi:cholesterol transport system auxiliary component
VIVRAIAIALGTASVAGCALLSPPDTKGMTAVLNKMPVEVPRRESRPVILLVFPPDANPIYDTVQMAYTLRPYEVAYFRDHQWGETPSQMLQPMLVKTLERTGYFGVVLTPPYTGRYTYALRTEILELMQDFTSEPATLRLSLRLQLSDSATGRLAATKEISVREPMQQKAPYAGVVAANEAVAKALQEAARFVLEKAD